LRICPEAQARVSSPTTAIAPPIAKVSGSGRAKIKKIAANKKPSGTLKRWIGVAFILLIYFSFLCLTPVASMTVKKFSSKIFSVSIFSNKSLRFVRRLSF
jgi:hypothetical protein